MDIWYSGLKKYHSEHPDEKFSIPKKGSQKYHDVLVACGFSPEEIEAKNNKQKKGITTKYITPAASASIRTSPQLEETSPSAEVPYTKEEEVVITKKTPKPRGKRVSRTKSLLTFSEE